MMRFKIIGVCAFATVLLAVGGIFYDSRTGRDVLAEADPRPLTMKELLEIQNGDLEHVDIGRMNLICARDADGTERIDVARLVKELDNWAEIAKTAEEHYRKSFEEHPERYDNSYAKYRAVNLALTVKEDMQCRYQKSLIASGAMDDIHSPRFFRNPDDVFISGLLLNRRGTCSSFPVLLVALGRRLGYPLYLKTTLGHMFCCWDDGTECFNLDTNGDAVDTPPDEYYLTDSRFGLKGRSLDVLQRKRKMVNLTNQEALGIFIETAAYSIEARGDSARASMHYAIAMRFQHAPANLRFAARQGHAATECDHNERNTR